MHSWEVVCLAVDDESPFDDCRQISSIGFLAANTLRTHPVDKVFAFLESNLSGFHVAADGTESPLRAARADGVRYVRTLEEDSPDDPLLGLSRCAAYEREAALAHL